MNEVTFTLRELHSKDVFPMFTIISKIGIKEFRECLDQEEIKKITKDGNASLDSIGLTIMFDVAGVVFSNLSRCEKDIYKFLSGISGMKETEIAELPMNTFMDMVIAVIKKDEFKDFIQVASKLFK